MHRTTIGDFELTALSDGIYHLDGGAYFGVVPKVLWSKKVEVDDHNRVPTGLNSVLVRTGDRNILIETGVGNKLPEKMAEIYGQPAQLLTNLSAAGLSPEDIHIVINSHLHFDHCGWNTIRKNGNIVPTFPNATYYAQHGEWEHAHQRQRDGVSYLTENYDPLVESGQMKLLRGDQEIVPGVSVKVFPGHTRDMQAIIIQGGGIQSHGLQSAGVQSRGVQSADVQSGTDAQRASQTACYISDLIPTSAHIDINWVMGFDLYPLETIESRKRYYAQSIPERWLTLFTHDPKIPWAEIQKDATGKLKIKA